MLKMFARKKQEAMEGVEMVATTLVSTSVPASLVPALSGLFLRGYETSLGWIKIVMSYLINNERDYVLRIDLRRLCRLFRDALPPVHQGIYTTFPHPKHQTFKCLVDSLNALAVSDPKKVPKYIFVGCGQHHVELYKDKDGDDSNSVHLSFPVSIMGEGSDNTLLLCGFVIGGNRHEQVIFKDLTVRNATYSGLFGNRGSSFLCQSCQINCSGACGVVVWNTKATLSNCQVNRNGSHGLGALCHGTLHVEGTQTMVEHNCHIGCVKQFGMLSCCHTSKIVLKSPLTPQTVSLNNGGGGNFGGSGRFDQVDNFGDDDSANSEIEDFPEEEESEEEGAGDASEAPMPDVVVEVVEVGNENEDVEDDGLDYDELDY